jgi:1-acyl-sn-glycerol-3-phosphate acyltransferase
MRRLLDWVTTLPFLVLFFATLVVFDLAGRVVRPFSMRGFEYVMAALQRTLMSLFAICGTRLRVERSPAIQHHTGYVVIANHQSMFDIALIGGLLFTNFPKYVAKAELGKWIPSISLNLQRGGNALIDRDNRRQAVTAITEMAETAQRRNVSVVIFPEGTRSRGGELGEFRRGGSVALLDAADQLPMVPVVIDGSWRLLRNNLLPVPYGAKVRIRFGDPVDRHPGDAKEMLDRAEAWIGDTLDGWRRAS